MNNTAIGFGSLQVIDKSTAERKKRLKLKSISVHKKFEPPKINPVKELVLSDHKGSDAMEQNFMSNFRVTLNADKKNLQARNDFINADVSQIHEEAPE